MTLEAAYQLKVDIDRCNSGCHHSDVVQHNGASIIEASRRSVDANQKVYRIKPFSDETVSTVEQRSLYTDSSAAQRPLRMLEPVLIACACLTIAALAAALVGWQRDGMMMLAAGMAAPLALIALALLHRHARQRRASSSALQNIEARVGGIVESAMDAIITVDEDQRILLFNA